MKRAVMETRLRSALAVLLGGKARRGKFGGQHHHDLSTAPPQPVRPSPLHRSTPPSHQSTNPVFFAWLEYHRHCIVMRLQYRRAERHHTHAHQRHHFGLWRQYSDGRVHARRTNGMALRHAAATLNRRVWKAWCKFTRHMVRARNKDASALVSSSWGTRDRLPTPRPAPCAPYLTPSPTPHPHPPTP